MDAPKLTIWMLCTVIFVKTAEGLRCYNCVSVDGSVPACEIPLNPASSSVLELDCDQAIPGTGEKHCAFTKDDGSVSGLRSVARTCIGNFAGLPANKCTSAGGATVCYCNDKDLCNDDKIYSDDPTNTNDNGGNDPTNTNDNGGSAATNTKIAIPLVTAMVLINFVF